MSALSAILGKEEAPVLAQQKQEPPVTTTPPPVVDNSNVQTQVSGSVQAQAQDAQKEVQESKPEKLAKQEPKQLTYQDMFKELNPYTPPTPEQLEKERKNQKRTQIISAISDGISSLANLYFASQGAPNMYDPKESMTEKNRALWDKLNKERKEDSARYATGIMNAAKLDEERANGERNYKLALEREKNDKEQWQKHFDLQQKAQEESAKLSREKFEHEKEQDRTANELAKQRMDEATRQFNVSSQQSAQRIKQESTRLQKEIQKGQVTFALGNGNGTVNVSTDALNAANVGFVFSKLPEEIRKTIGSPIYDKYSQEPLTQKVGDKEEIIRQEPTMEAMLVAIGTYVQQYPDVQDALREIAGQKVEEKGNGYNSGADNQDNRGY